MTASTHKKIRKHNKFWVSKIKNNGKKPLIAPVKEVNGPILMASDTIGTKSNASHWLYYKGVHSTDTSMSFIVDTTKNPDNNLDTTFIVPFTLYTPNYNFTIDWGDDSTTNISADSALTTASLTHTYNTAGQYCITIISESKKIPVLNFQTSGNTNGNKQKLIQFNTPLLAFDTSCPNYNSAQYFAYECSNLISIPSKFLINNGHITNYNYCFSKCTMLIHIPDDLLKYVKYQSTYQDFLSHNTALQYIPQDLFATSKGTDFSGAFSGDSNLILDVDLDVLFGTEPYINTDIHELFRDCVKTTGDAVEFTRKFTEYVAYVEGTGTFDTGWGELSGKIYPQPLYNSDGVLVRDLVPAKTGNFYGGKVAPQDCLWDEVQQEFLLPTTTYTYGTEIDMRSAFVIEDGKLVGVNENVYLQNTGTSYINTGIIADSDTKLVINYKIDSSREISSSTRNWICGGSAVYMQRKNFYGGFWQTSATNIYYWLNTSDKGAGYNAGAAFTDFTAKYKIELNGVNIDTKSYLYKNNTTSWTYTNTAGEITQSNPVTIFTRYGNISSASSYFLGRVYDCSISKNGVLLQKLVPVPKGLVIGDFVVPSNGMFDIVTQTFYGNEGAGEFNIGTDTPLDIDRENNLPYSFKKNALYNCDRWNNFAVPERVWTGQPMSNENWLAVDAGKNDWLLVDGNNTLLTEIATSNIKCSATDTLLADEVSTLGWLTGPRSLREPDNRGIIKPEPYESADSLRNIIEGLPELRGYEVVGSPTITDGVVSNFSNANYIQTSENFSFENPLEIYFTATTSSNVNTSQLFCSVGNGGANRSFGVTIETGGKMGVAYTLNGSAWIGWLPSSYVFEGNTRYNFLIQYIPSQFFTINVKKSTETSWTTFTNSLAAPIYTSAGCPFIFGQNYQNKPFFGSIDLNETYIKVNNKVWFDGTEKLNEVLDLSACIYKNGLTTVDLNKVIDKGYTLVLN